MNMNEPMSTKRLMEIREFEAAGIYFDGTVTEILAELDRVTAQSEEHKRDRDLAEREAARVRMRADRAEAALAHHLRAEDEIQL